MGQIKGYEIVNGQRGEVVRNVAFVSNLAGYYLAQVFGGRDRNSIVTEVLTPADGDWSVTIRKTGDNDRPTEYVFTGPAHEFNSPAVIGLILHHIAERCADVRPPGRR